MFDSLKLTNMIIQKCMDLLTYVVLPRVINSLGSIKLHYTQWKMSL